VNKQELGDIKVGTSAQYATGSSMYLSHVPGPTDELFRKMWAGYFTAAHDRSIPRPSQHLNVDGWTSTISSVPPIDPRLDSLTMNDDSSAPNLPPLVYQHPEAARTFGPLTGGEITREQASAEPGPSSSRSDAFLPIIDGSLEAELYQSHQGQSSHSEPLVRDGNDLYSRSPRFLCPDDVWDSVGGVSYAVNQ
jgi:hypothetical protein